MNAIHLKQLTKRHGVRRGVENLTLEVPRGVIFGLIGPNGAGKSTTLRTMLGLLKPTSGSVELLGRDVQRDAGATRASLGYLPGENQFDPGLTVRQVLDWQTQFFPGDHRGRRKALVARFELDLSARADDLSLGNKKKVAVVGALQHRPALLVLDEPTNGLDPVMQARLFEELQGAAADGATVLFSSHVLSEVQRVCRTVAVLAEGRLVAVEDVEALRRRQVRRVAAVFTADGAALSKLAGVSDWALDKHRATFLYSGELRPLLQVLAALAPTDLHIEEPTLEEIVMQHSLIPAGEAQV